MKITRKRRHCYLFCGFIILFFIIFYIIWNNMKPYGPWMDQATEIKIEWYDYQGIKHQGQLSSSEKLNLNTKLEAINEKHKLFFLPESRTGELSYNIYYYGIKEVQYTIKSSGILIVQSMSFPYQRSAWKVDQEKTDEMIGYIKSLIDWRACNGVVQANVVGNTNKSWRLAACFSSSNKISPSDLSCSNA